ALVVLVLVAFAALFPRQTLLEQMRREKSPDPLAVAYLTNLLRTRPDDAELRLQLARQQLALGDAAGALRSLAALPASAAASLRQQADLLELRALSQQLARLPAGARQGVADGRRAQALLAALAPLDWSTPDLAFLAAQARAVGEPKLTAKFYQRIIDTDGDLPLSWFTETANEAIGVGDFRLAAAVLFAAQARAPARGQQRLFFLRAVKTLQSGDLVQEALSAADAHVGDLINDETVLLYLTELARSANDLPRAERYARRLLRMGAAKPAAPATTAALIAQRVLDWLVPSASAAEAPAAGVPAAPEATSGPAVDTSAPVGMRPYDERAYLLAWEIFLAARNLEDAYRVAASAVRQRPEDPVWRQRLAQVSEWTQRPQLALEQWLALARGGNESAWGNVMRLAPGLNDDEALLAGLQHAVTRGDLSARDWRLLAEAFERVGRPADGIDYLERRYAARPSAVILENEAWLAARMGRDDQALSALTRLIDVYGATPERVTEAAVLMVRRARFQDAYALLERHRGVAAARDEEYWRLLGDLAWQLARDATALEAYRKLAADGKAEPTELERLVMLMRPLEPESAARLAEAGWRRTGFRQLLLMAIEIYESRGDLPALKRLFAGIDAKEEAALAGNLGFVLARARFRAASGDAAGAREDYRRALALAPGDPDVLSAYLWFLIGERRHTELARLLEENAKLAAEAPALWPPYAAGLVALNQPLQALPFFARELRRDPARTRDALWLMGYADALEGAGFEAMAWRLRRQAWTALRDERQLRPLDRAQLQVAARLALQQGAGGDAQLGVFRQLLAPDAAALPGGTEAEKKLMDASTRELVLSWMLTGETRDAARRWLWQAYGRNLARPGWAEVALAIQDNDRATLDRLLARDLHDVRDDGLPDGVRLEAARALGELPLARALAFQMQARAPHDDNAHAALVDTALALANRLEAGTASFLRGAVKGTETVAAVSHWLTPRLRMDVYLNDTHQWTTNVYSIVNIPSHDRQVQVGLLWREGNAGGTGDLDGNFSRLRFGWRSAFTDFGVARAERSWRFGGGTLLVGAGWNLLATESVPLRVAGMKRQVDATVTVDFSRREYGLAQVFGARYYTQDDAYLGNGYGLNWELGHRIRLDYPDLAVRLAGASQRYTANGQPNPATAIINPGGAIPTAGLFMPQSFDLVGLYGGFGTSLRTEYTRALRPFADVGLSYNTLSGNGYSMLFGAAGSVFGSDHLQLYWTQALGGSGTNALLREFGLRYQYFY
ncbi:MAG: tetratricopeptide repeat protein, partial [Burkholderiales bacterium]